MKKKRLIKNMLLVLTFLIVTVLFQVTVNARGTDSKTRTGWVSYSDGNYYYLNEQPISAGWHRINGVNCFFEWNGRAASGWIKYNSSRYYLTEYGRPLTGWRKINGVSCWFDKYGRAGQGWLSYNGRRYYLNGYGRPLTGWQTISGKRYYFNQYGHALPGWIKYRGMRYCLDSYGKVHYGWKKIGKHCYYFDLKYGYARTGWQTINGTRCCFNSYGQALTGIRTINGIRYTFSDYGRVISSVDPVVYRAVVIGESDYRGQGGDLIAPMYDAEAVTAMCKKTGYTTVKKGINISAYNIYNLINSTFAAANSNDVSMFFYSGHGSGDGTLVMPDYEGISMYALADWLKQIPGNVVVILDSCHSGAAIGKTMEDLQSFNDNVIAAFDDVELEVENDNAKGGPMFTSKFKVLTSCSQSELSYEIYDDSGMHIGLFTHFLLRGSGFGDGGNRLSSAYADTNYDKKITLKELYNYTYRNCRYFQWGNAIIRQSVRCYPETSSFKLFQR